MNLGVGDIPPSGRRIVFDSDVWAIDAGRNAASGEVRSVTGDLLASDEGAGVVRFTGSARLVAELPCDRCSEATEVDVQADISLSYAPVVPRRTTSLDEEEIELSEDELDAGWYEGTTIDMGSVLCEALSLAWPARIVCSDTQSCEVRARALLKVGSAEMSPFAALRGLVDA